MNGAQTLISDYVQSLELEFDGWATCLTGKVGETRF